jgi:hypothetical protein
MASEKGALSLFAYRSYSCLFLTAPRHSDPQDYTNFGPTLHKNKQLTKRSAKLRKARNKVAATFTDGPPSSLDRVRVFHCFTLVQTSTDLGHGQSTCPTEPENSAPPT